MKKKHLTVSREHRCIGCNLCTLAAARYEERKLGIKNPVIKIKGAPGRYKIQIDYGVNIKNPAKIVNICPQNCFDLIDNPY
jgi:NAD-dependent dihydropyrimidine dehydrogenase PreA subunit